MTTDFYYVFSCIAFRAFKKCNYYFIQNFVIILYKSNMQRMRILFGEIF